MANAADIGLRYLYLAHQVRRRVDERLAADGVSLSRLKLLQAVQVLAPVTQARLAAELDQAPRSITQAVEALERDGLLRRGISETDRRAKLVELTASGRAAVEAGVRAGESALREVFGGLDTGQLAALAGLLEVVAGGLAAREAAD